ncbi:MAG: ribonuclease E/G, partial [Bdellovibrio sp.]
MLATGLPLEVLSVMATEILINVRSSETRVAFVENGVLADLTIEKKSSPTFVGSIFRGIVTRVLPGMQAAFVDIGLEKAGFLYVGDVLDESNIESGFLESESEAELEADTEVRPSTEASGPNTSMFNPGSKTPIQQLLKEGQDILVQVSKDPLGTKGARLTTHLSLAGRFLVYLPNARQLGISRKIESEAERNRLKNLVKSIQPHGGVIVRTAGEGASEESLRWDIESMDRVAKEVFRNYEKRKTPGLVYQEIDVELRALRDML